MNIFVIKRYFTILLLSLSIFLFSNIGAAQNFPDKSSSVGKTAKTITRPQNEDISLLVWANEAAVSAYSYNFVNYKQQLKEASRYFTPEGWKHFKTALKASGNLEAVVKKKLVVSAVATGSPIIVNKSRENGKSAWHVQMPLLVTWQSATEHIQSHLIINMDIIKISDETRSFALDSFVATSP